MIRCLPDPLYYVMVPNKIQINTANIHTNIGIHTNQCPRTSDHKFQRTEVSTNPTSIIPHSIIPFVKLFIRNEHVLLQSF